MNTLDSNLVLAQQAGDIQQENGFEPIKDREVILKLSSLALKNNNANTGKYVEAEFTVAEENNKYVGRKIWELFNVVHQSEKAQQIGLGRLKAFVVAVNGELNPTEQFTLQHVNNCFGIPFVAKIKIAEDTNNNTGEIKKVNKITSFVGKFDAFAQTANQNQNINTQQQAAPNFGQQGHAQTQGQSPNFAQPQSGNR